MRRNRQHIIALLLAVMAQILPVEGWALSLLSPSQMRQTGAPGTSTEGRLTSDRPLTPWLVDPALLGVDADAGSPESVGRVKICRTETLCKLSYKEGQRHRARLKNPVPPLLYSGTQAQLSEPYLQQLSSVYTQLRGRGNIRIRLIAYSDDAPLSADETAVYGDHNGLAKAVARRAAVALGDALQLPEGVVESEGRGPETDTAQELSPRERALQRRIEVELWYDDPLQSLPDEPQLCPEATGAERVTRIHHSPAGELETILFEHGQPVVSVKALSGWRRALAEVAGKTNPRLRFIGSISNERLDRRTAVIYGDDVGLSLARARRAMELVQEKLSLLAEQVEFDGRGYVQNDDVVNFGFIETDQSRVEVQVVYDELAILDDYEGVEITRLTREVETRTPYSLNLMRISVDGKPVDDPGKSIPDVQRCTDVALDQVGIVFKHDSLSLTPRLNVSAWPRSIRYGDVVETAFPENRVAFQLYSNYRNFYDRAEVRIFSEDQSRYDTPLAVVELDERGSGFWLADFPDYEAPGLKLNYLLRVSDTNGHFDETEMQQLWIIDRVEAQTVLANARNELLAGYGESRIAVRNIPLQGGAVQASGRQIPAGHRVWLAGYPVPVDGQGRFVAEEILPTGLHTVEVAVTDESGNGELYLRDLELKQSDWFGVGIADLTLAGNETNGPANLLDPDNKNYSDDFSMQGRLAFYSKGKFRNGWSLTASADTREGPLDEIFSNFMDKTSAGQLRRMDPDRHYPTLGDDSTVIEDAPTRGKFYLRLQKEETYSLWGNFKTSYRDNELAAIERELYGLNLHHQGAETTGFGANKLEIDGFIADPGTINGRDDLRGSGGSLYYLSNQDILEGSENLRIEVRDKDSNLVIAAKELKADLDYDIDYLQGRVLLTDVLPTIADDNLLAGSAAIGGNPVFLVAHYEYTPGVTDPDTLVSGGRAHYWLNDYVGFGVTGAWTEEADVKSSLGGADLTLRKSAATWLKLEIGQTEGNGVLTSTSSDGGYSYSSDAKIAEETSASGYRVEGSLNLADIRKRWRGHMTFYLQNLEAGYSVTGLTTETDLSQYGVNVAMPIGERWHARLKYDSKNQDEQLETEAGEVNVAYRLNDNWSLSAGVRNDSRTVLTTTTTTTREEGELTDAVVRADYNSCGSWNLYSYVQETLRADGNRDDNGRVGVGAGWRLSERLHFNAELSEGDLGSAASLGSEFLYSDRTTIYTNYALENERSDNGVLARKGNMTSGFRSRYSDVTSLYLEEKYSHGDTPTGLVHSAGVELTPTERLNFKVALDLGTLKEPDTAATLERTAAAVSVGYGFERLSLAGGVEYRVDDSEQSDGSFNKRTTWLLKNSFKYKLNDSWRLLGKFNMSMSESSLGSSFDGDYTEAVLGYAYRPVAHDRLNLLFKYTYFYNLPASDATSSAATTYIQRSHIAAVDLMYDLTERWTIGGKYAYRLGQIALDRDNPQYFDSRAQLIVGRVDWHFLHRWDALAEARLLDLPDAGDQRSGALLALYRHFGNHVKAGVGYNFSDFSDDLTQLDYRHQGLFVNVIGKF